MNNAATQVSNSVEYQETSEQAREHLRLTLPTLVKFKLSPNPVNYALCYECVSGRNQELQDAMSRALNGSDGLSAETTQELYRRYIWDEDKKNMERLRAELRRMVVETMSGVGQALGQATQSNSTLTDCSDKLQKTDDISEMRRIVVDVVSEVKEFSETSVALKDALSETQNEVEKLREALERTKQEAKSDALTGLSNRRAFNKALAGAMEDSAQSGEELCLLMADIDHFKKVNDTYGHLVGDKVIRFVAEQLSANVKGKDTVARIGGEEFAVILPNTTLHNALAVGDSICSIIEKSRLKRADTGVPMGRITISMGATGFKAGEQAEQFIDRADQALYDAKNSGRNKVSAGY